MIKVKMFRDEYNKIIDFSLSGHANSGPYGYDLVCAGVSAVTFGAVNAVMELCDTELIIEQGDTGGFLSVKLSETLQGDQLIKAQLLLEGMLISLKTIERDYRKFIKINEQ